MSASDHLSQEQFRLFHGTNRKIKGDFINPTRQRGPEWDGHGPEQAFASAHLDDAARYGSHVYEVYPHDDIENHGSGVFGSSEGFKIKSKVAPEVIEHHTRVVGPMRESKEQREHGKWMHETNRESWSHQGDNVYHIKYDKEGNEIRSQVAKLGDRPK